MITTLKSVEDKDETSPVYELVMGNNDFVHYVNDIINTRDNETSEFFVKHDSTPEDSEDNSNGFQYDEDDDFDGVGDDVDDEIVGSQ
ncbi:hypothetical protein KM1_207780 [Entamoeba histolytica HM-3:IMSS]|nr:hypothetical protein KM1_207780 [Entamoeba histolytica HM-3:IMSS]